MFFSFFRCSPRCICGRGGFKLKKKRCSPQICLGKRRWTNPFWRTLFFKWVGKTQTVELFGCDKKEGWNWNPTLLPYFYSIKGFLVDDRIDPLALWRTPAGFFLVLGKVRVISSSGWFWKKGSGFKINVLFKAHFKDITPKIDLKVSKIMLSCFIQHHSTSFWWCWKQWMFIAKILFRNLEYRGAIRQMFFGVGGSDAIKKKPILMPMIWTNQHDSKSVCYVCWLSMISRYTCTLQPGVVFEPVLVLLTGGIPIPIHLGPFVQRFRGCSHWRALSKTLSKGEANSAARTTHLWKIWISTPMAVFFWMDFRPARCIVLRIVS